jgi:hypothetical protein
MGLRETKAAPCAMGGNGAAREKSRVGSGGVEDPNPTWGQSTDRRSPRHRPHGTSKAEPQRRTIRKLAQALGVDPAQLVE